jgi:putative tryptophan/tyrosine transport system substrate-binding protein
MAGPTKRQSQTSRSQTSHPWAAALLAWLALLLLAGTVRAGDIVIVLSSDAAPYAQAEGGFKTKFIDPNSSVRSILLSDVTDQGMDAALGKSPQAVVAIGTPAAAYLHRQLPPSIPLLYCMVTNPAHAGLTEGRPVAGVTIDVPIAAQIALIAQADPKARTLGMLYRAGAPDSKDQIDRVQEAMPAGWKLETVAVDQYGSVADAIDALTSRHIDVIWTNLDSGIYETATVRTLLLAGLRTNLPVFGFSPAFVRAGALIGIGVDPVAQGQQAAGLTLRLLKNPSDGTIARIQVPEQFQIAVNLVVAEKLGVQLPSDLIGRATYVFGEDR